MLALRPVDRDAGDRQPTLVEHPDPVPGPGEALVRVRATALNRADLLQLRGLYPPPSGESEIPGLECSGEIEALGPATDGHTAGDGPGYKAGDRVMALLAGGGHAQKVAVPVGQLMPIPNGLSFEQAAALPEVGLTSWVNLVIEGELTAGQTVLIVAAASGVGTFAVQLAAELGAKVLVAGRSLERLERLRELAEVEPMVLGERLVTDARAANGGRGVDLIMDLAGGQDLGPRLGALGRRGRCVLVGILAGNSTDIDLGDVLRRRIRIQGSVLRSRSRSEKARAVEEFMGFAGPRLDDGRLRPVIDDILPFERIAEAYDRLRKGGVWGKLVLRVP